MRKHLLLVLGVLCGILFTPLLSSAQITAYRIINARTNLALEVGGGGNDQYENGAYTNQWEINGGLNQLWTLQTVQTPSGEGFYIVNLNSGQVLQAASEGLSEVRVRTFPRVAGNYKQIWQSSTIYPPVTGPSTQPYPSGPRTILTNVGGSGNLRITSNATLPGASINCYPNYLTQEEADKDPALYSWTLVPVSVPGRFATIKNVRSGLMLEVSGGSTASGAKIGQWTWNGTPAQGWIIEPIGDGYFVIRNRNSNQALEIGGKNPDADGAAANQYSYWGGTNQQWQFLPSGGPVIKDAYRIVNRRTGQVLEIGGNDVMSPGRPANQWPYWGGTNQMWIISY